MRHMIPLLAAAALLALGSCGAPSTDQTATGQTATDRIDEGSFDVVAESGETPPESPSTNDAPPDGMAPDGMAPDAMVDAGEAWVSSGESAILPVPNSAQRPIPAPAPKSAPASAKNIGAKGFGAKGKEAGRPPATATGPATGPPDADQPCAAAGGELLPVAVCAAYERLRPAMAGFNTPNEIALGETVPIRFVLVRDAAAGRVAEALEGLPGGREEFPVQASRYMRAQLIARTAGLAVTPLGDERQDLLSRPEIAWDWNVTATAAGTQRLTLRLFAELGRDDSGKLWETSEDRVIQVRVPADVRAAGLLQRLSTLADSGKGAVVALTALVAALGGLWLAVRHIGRS